MSQTVQRAIDILDFCSTHPRTLQEISARFTIHRTTAMRLINTLQGSGFIRKDEHGRYGVGLHLAALAESALRQFNLRDIVHPHLTQLSAKVSQTVQFAVKQDKKIIYVDKIEPESSIRLDTRIGGEVILQTAGVAKAIMSHLPSDELTSMLDSIDWKSYTPSSIMSVESMEERLRETHQNGWAYDDGEYEEISNCIAAPVHNYLGDVVGAISITAIKTKLDIDHLKQLLPHLLETVNQVSQDLGWQPADSV